MRPMRFAIVSPATPDVPTHAVTAEELGFDSGWLFDSHMVYSDVYVIMALAAARTRRMTFGTGIAVAPSRIAPVTAHSIATLNALYPGRVELGIGTGNTGRRTMGMPPMKLGAFRDYLQVLRGLLRGETVEYREGDVVRPIRFMHPERGVISLDGPIPVHVAAFGPKALELAGEVGDGWITFWGGPDDVRAAHKMMEVGAKKAGRTLPEVGFRTICFHNVWVTRPGERVDSEQARMALGPSIFSMIRYQIHAGSLAVDAAGKPIGVPEMLARPIERFLGWMKRENIDPDRDFARFYENYFLRLRKEHYDLLDADTIRAITIAGPPEECVERIRDFERAGVTDFGIVLGGNAHELMKRFAKHVIRRW
jgi:alkanesulfonate monooxygenase SsuD/methylene tetrahydromethanopterin reductase-like flavin-dependent oxidoreductase (luciferase family)